MRSRWVLRLKSRLDRFFRRPAVDATVMALVLISVVLVVVELYEGVQGEALERVMLASDVITGIFIVELSLRWFAAPSTKAHWQEFWLDWLAVIPVFRPLRALRALRFLRALRLLRLYRFGILAHRFAGTLDPRQFEDALEESLVHYAGPHEDVVRLAPELYRALTNLLDDGRVHDSARGMICRAVAYFVMPFDVLPEEVHGGEGFLDDVYFALWTLRSLGEELPEHVLEDAWEGEGLLVELLDEVLPEVEALLEAEDREQIHRYVGVGRKAVAAG